MTINNKKEFIQNSFYMRLKLLVTEFYAYYKLQFPLLIFFMALTAFVEGLGMLLILPFIGSMGLASATEMPDVNRKINEALSYFSIENNATSIFVLIVLTLVLQLLLMIWTNWKISYTQRKFGQFWQKRLLKSLLETDYYFVSSKELGSLVNNLTQEIARISGSVLIILQVLATGVTTLFYIIISFWISWEITSLLIILGITLFLSVHRIGKKNYQIGEAIGPLNSKLTISLTEFLGSIKFIMASNLSSYAFSKSSEIINKLTKNLIFASFLPGLVRALFEFGSIIFLCFILMFSRYIFTMPIENVLVTLAIFVRLLPKFTALQQNIQNLGTYISAFAFVRDLTLTSEFNKEKLSSITSKKAGSLNQAGSESSGLKIEIDKFSIESHTILQNINVKIPERGITGIAGYSGAGKSSLANFILGLGINKKRSLSINGVYLHEIGLEKWREHFAYVPQEPVLFHASIEENIIWNLPSVTFDQVKEAAIMAGAHNFIMEKKDGYKTVIGDAGTKISGGQRQRLAIAQALIRKPKFLILDEFTSALDTDAENKMINLISELKNKMSIILISHNIHFMAHCEQILLMNNGRIEKVGSFDDLKKTSSIFRKLLEHS